LWLFTHFLPLAGPDSASVKKFTGLKRATKGLSWGKNAIFCCNFSHFYTFFTPARAIFSSSFYRPPYTATIKNNTSGGVP